MYPQETLEFMVVDFSDYTLHLKDGTFVFGLACGLVLWRRVVVAAMRLAQASYPAKTARLQYYMDDPIIVMKGRTDRK